MSSKTKLYLVRHCEATGNKDRIFHGHFDSEITENGKNQLLLLKRRFESEPIDILYSSDLRRAFLTAQAIGGDAGMPVIVQENLREIFGGEWEDVEFTEIAKRYPELFRQWSGAPGDFAMPGGESYRQFYDRIYRAIMELVEKNSGKTVAIATHGTVIKLFLAFAKGLSVEESEQISWCDNTAVSLIEFDRDKAANIVYMNDHSHLSEETQTISTQKWWKEYSRRRSENI